MFMYIGIGGYLLLFAIVSGLFRYEYDMPRPLCVGFAGAIVTFGLAGSAAVSVFDLVSLQQASGVSALALIGCMIGLVLVGEDTSAV